MAKKITRKSVSNCPLGVHQLTNNFQDAPCSSNYDDQDGFYEHPDCTDGNDCTTDSQVEQDCIGVQLVLSDEPVEEVAPKFSSTLAMAIYKALGEDQDIAAFDRLHTKLKSSKKPPNNDYMRTLALLQQKVLLKKTSKAQAIRMYEKTAQIAS